MDSAWIAEALAALEPRAAEAVARASQNQWNADNAPALAGTSRPDVQGLFELEPREHAAPFIRMLAHPALLCRLQWMLGPGFSCHQNTAICSGRGTGGQQMHAGAGPGDEYMTPEGENNPQHLYAVRGHQTFCNKVNVAWQLTDTEPSDGGFVSPHNFVHG